jgi:hypothetical protein
MAERGLDRAEGAEPDGRVGRLRDQVGRDARLRTIPETLVVPAHEEAFLGESRRAESAGQLQVVLEVKESEFRFRTGESGDASA